MQRAINHSISGPSDDGGCGFSLSVRSKGVRSGVKAESDDLLLSAVAPKD